MSTAPERLAESLEVLEQRRGRLDPIRKAWAGESPAAFLSAESRDALDKRLRRLGVNFPRLAVRSLVDRLTVSGFRAEDDDDADDATWRLYERAGLVAGSELVHTDRALYGAAYVMVWGHARDPRRPVVVLDNPRTAHVETDPATGEVVRAVRRWTAGGKSHALMVEPDAFRRYSAHRDAPGNAPGSWTAGEAWPNPWGSVPVVPFVRRQTTDDHDTGTPFVADILDLTDAVAKVLQDAMVTSEYYARPRRWATGLEIVEDEDGNPVDPFGDGRFLQSEAPETRFGQLDAARLDGYSDLLASLTQQIGTLTGLPPHYLGLHGDQPPNADSIRASETQLSSLAYSEHRQLSPAWSDVAGWLHAVAEGLNEPPTGLRTLWASPETRTPGQAADAAAKLAGIGVPLRALLADPLGYESDEISGIMAEVSRTRFEAAATDLRGLMP